VGLDRNNHKSPGVDGGQPADIAIELLYYAGEGPGLVHPPPVFARISTATERSTNAGRAPMLARGDISREADWITASMNAANVPPGWPAPACPAGGSARDVGHTNEWRNDGRNGRFPMTGPPIRWVPSRGGRDADAFHYRVMYSPTAPRRGGG